ncbi:hypothetical protein LOAG_09691 [Loa loa]|uniref:Uncharacterized protein n=1 Tax=Loa loa TaxID=7209 RepID=A0A1S0TRD8_LOALO|nr:hypothetical protein LOAG_09691 [Loa loa]EFO18806.1 hypothetical protein LOAG_09691 [Loa loa]
MSPTIITCSFWDKINLLKTELTKIHEQPESGYKLLSSHLLHKKEKSTCNFEHSFANACIMHEHMLSFYYAYSRRSNYMHDDFCVHYVLNHCYMHHALALQIMHLRIKHNVACKTFPSLRSFHIFYVIFFMLANAVILTPPYRIYVIRDPAQFVVSELQIATFSQRIKQNDFGALHMKSNTELLS